MGLENYSNIESVTVAPKNTEEEINREFDALLKEFSEMSPKDRGEIIIAMANNDPQFAELYKGAKQFFQERVMNLEDYDVHLKIEAIKKFIEGVDLDYGKNESVRFEGNIKNLENIRAIFYREGGDNELHSRFFTIGNIENQKLATIKEEFLAWIERTRAYIDRKYKKENIIKIEENNEEIKTIELSDEVIEIAFEKGTEKINQINEGVEREKQLQSKILKLNLILDISSMYKEYLENLLSRIKLKFASEKDERYEKQIDLIESKVRNINNIKEFVNLLGNEEELLQIDIKKLLEKLLISEEKIAETGLMDQPISFMWNKNNTIENVNSSYESIINSLSNLDIESQNVRQVRLGIFNEFRRLDRLDDDFNIYNTSESIRIRLTGNILHNKDLNLNETIKPSLDFLNGFSENNKIELYNALNGGKEVFQNFLDKKGVFDLFPFDNELYYKTLSGRIYSILDKGIGNLNIDSLKSIVKKETENKIKYLEKNLNPSNNNEEISKEIKRLKDSIKGKKIDEQIEEIKIETAYKSFERFIINFTFEKHSKIIEEISNKNKDVEIYSDIEGIGKKVSDENFNNIVSGTQFLAEQIALMAISGGIGNAVFTTGLSIASKSGKVASFLNSGSKLSKITTFGASSVIEGGAFYLSYTGLNGLVNEKELSQAFDKLNGYDAIRTMLFLGVLRTFKNTEKGLNFKSISLDTRNILGTDLIIRGVGDLLGKEGIGGLDIRNPSNFNIVEFTEFLVEEIAFILPLIVGLRLMEGRPIMKTKPEKTSVTVEKDTVYIEIGEAKNKLRLAIQKRNIAKNKGTKGKKLRPYHDEVSKYKEQVKQNNKEYPEQTKAYNEELEAKNRKNTSLQDDKSKVNKSKDSNADENVNMNTGIPLEYQRLIEFSKQAQKGKVDYSLKTKEIEEIVSKKGFGKDGKNVGEGLLKKAEIDSEIVKEYKKTGRLSGEEPYKKVANRELEKANRMVYNEYKKGISEYFKGKPLEYIFPNLSTKLIGKLEKIYLDDLNLIPEKEGKTI